MLFPAKSGISTKIFEPLPPLKTIQQAIALIDNPNETNGFINSTLLALNTAQQQGQRIKKEIKFTLTPAIIIKMYCHIFVSSKSFLPSGIGDMYQL
ncbi:MAG: hypothetical protein K2L48_02020 [Mycoplasmoidaceae bacterium]|nr:hypothetical protein [Mycoplasmoidaceae bacterium]